MNAVSSRSHAVVQIVMHQTEIVAFINGKPKIVNREVCCRSICCRIQGLGGKKVLTGSVGSFAKATLQHQWGFARGLSCAWRFSGLIICRRRFEMCVAPPPPTGKTFFQHEVLK